MSDYGTGFAIDDRFDLSVTTGGDLARTGGLQHLEDNLVTRLADALAPVIGQGLATVDLTDLEATATGALKASPHVEAVQQLSASVDSRTDEITVAYDVATESGRLSTTEVLRQ